MGTATVELLELQPTRQVVRYVAPGAEPVAAFIECPAGLAQDMTAWVAAFAPVASMQGHDLHIGGTVDAEALDNGVAGLRVLRGWYGAQFRETKLTADRNAPVGPRSAGTGSFFSGGVDSFYSALVERPANDSVTHLVLVLGFDVHLHDAELISLVRRQVQSAAEELGHPLLEVWTNISTIMVAAGLDWEHHAHGAGLGAIAQSLSPHLGRAYVPSTFDERSLVPHGSHPALDPSWGSARLEVVHDGVQLSRTSKLAAIGSSTVALGRLRVCYENTDGAYNCGRCAKCTRTIVGLQIAGLAGKCGALPARPNSRSLRRLGWLPTQRHFIREQLREPAIASHPGLRRSLRGSLLLGIANDYGRRVARWMLRLWGQMRRKRTPRTPNLFATP